jgi:hypothetical protein
MNRKLKFKALYENKLHDVYSISFPDLLVKIPLQRFPFKQDVKPDEIIQFIDKTDVNGYEIFEGDYDNDGNCVVWCDKCNSWQFAQLDVPTREICIPCHSCDGNFMFDDHIQEFEKVSNRFI